MTTDIIAEQPVLLERDTLSRAKLWYESLQQQAKLIDANSPNVSTSRLKVRAKALGPLRQPVFVLGCPRSGTTYLGTLLSELRDSTYIYEPQILKYYVRLVRQAKVTSLHADAIYRLGLRSLVMAGPGHGARPIEKNPNHVFAVEHLKSVFPDARFVVITRDGRDVAVSLNEKPWHRADAIGSGREPGGYLNGPYPHFYIEPDRADEYIQTSDIHRCIWIWRQHQEEVERVRHSDDINQLHIRYEDLVLKPSETVDVLCDFLDASSESRSAVHQRARSGRSSSVGRWRDVLDQADMQVVDKEAGELLRHLGYG